jgi:LPS-assembly lipoprotein
MWCSDRRALLAGLLAVGACGFRPVYGPGGTGRTLQGRVRAADPVSRADYLFLAAFEDRLGRPDPGVYDLTYRITTDRVEAGRIQGLGATRILLNGALDYTLTQGGTRRAAGRVTAEAAFSTTATQLAAQTAEDDAEARLMRMLAEALVARLLADPSLAA